MWPLLILASICAVNQARILHQDIGSIHIHAKARGPTLEEYLPLDQNDIATSQSLLAFFEELKPKLGPTIMHSGGEKHFTMNEISTDVNLKLYDFMLRGLQNVVFHSLIIRMKNGRVDFNASVPLLSAACTVFVNGVIDGNHTYAIFTNLSAVAEGVTIAGTLNIIKKEFPSSLRSAQSTALQIDDADVTIDINNMVLQLKITEELQAFKMSLALFMSKPIDNIIKSITNAVLLVLNEQLSKFQLAGLKYFLRNRSAVPYYRRQLQYGPYLRSPNYRYT